MRRPIHSNKFWAADQTGCTCDHSPGKNWKNFLRSFFEAHGSWSSISMVWALIRMHVHRSGPILTELPILAVGPEIHFSKPSRWFYACSIWEPVSEARSARRCVSEFLLGTILLQIISVDKKPRIEPHYTFNTWHAFKINTIIVWIPDEVTFSKECTTQNTRCWFTDFLR